MELLRFIGVARSPGPRQNATISRARVRHAASEPVLSLRPAEGIVSVSSRGQHRLRRATGCHLTPYGALTAVVLSLVVLLAAYSVASQRRSSKPPLGIASSAGGHRAYFGAATLVRATASLGAWPNVTHFGAVSGSSWLVGQVYRCDPGWWQARNEHTPVPPYRRCSSRVRSEWRYSTSACQ